MLGNFDEKSVHDRSLRFAITRIGEPDPFEAACRRAPLDTPAAVARFWRNIIAREPSFEPSKEHLISIIVNARIFPHGYNVIAVGSLTECTAHPREILRPCIISAGYGFICCHNHPSGDPNPSSADKRMTIRIRDAAEILQVNFLDHVVIGDDTLHSPGFFSFREAELL